MKNIALAEEYPINNIIDYASKDLFTKSRLKAMNGKYRKRKFNEIKKYSS